MSISLRDITNENWIECIFLTTNKEDQHFICEEFVASNALSLAQSKIQKGWITKAIYNDETMVGFTMYGYCEQHHFFEICRLMIDHKHQGKGYGKTALLHVIDELRKNTDCHEIFLSFEPKNIVAKQLYEVIGFEDTGRMIDGECLYKVKLPSLGGKTPSTDG
ncbi:MULTISPECIES: GNAT family N-acetyltransferase [Bacillus cereus group]|uniref:GNAT family N-acetyltransferase n=1 Tax=Bacillus cereus TaxID=1396 RepID=A0AA44QBB5_BACCE|nr:MULTISPECIES: GNAT family N-acetyltransferase [Bacillus cereus group]EEL48502.1 diamine N-acetyltransferase [Bacillus cereus Rock3-44]PFN06427.1 GNAT family N-acetyltransferase [Bacillus cereus]PFO82019.1 GNAT family N-acetyltransferase [Bacillus cereus]PFS01533.1 GNAT family N-acetyltransferase [Bacillus cereus]